LKTVSEKISFTNRLLLGTVALVFLASVAFRISLLHLPIDRDEGEFAYAGWRMLHGGIPYLEFYNMKMPGIYTFYALLFSVFGSSVAAIRIGLIIVNVINAFLVYRLTKKWSDLRTGFYACICYLIFSIQFELQGTSTHAEHIAMLFVLAGLLIFTSAVNYKSAKQLFWSGVLLGTAFIVKQPSFSFIVMGIFLLLSEKFKNRNTVKDFLRTSSIFFAGAIVPFIATVALLVAAGAGKNFYLFAFQYAKEYVSLLTIHDGFNNLNVIFSKGLAPNIFLWILVPAGIVIIFFQSGKSAAMIWLFVFSFLAVSAGYYFRPHYFQFLIPASSMIVAAALVVGEKFFNQRNSSLSFLPFLFLMFATGYYINNNRSLFSAKSQDEAIREIYGQDFFNATKKAGDYIAKHSSENSTVAIFGAEPEIWFYAKRKAASGYLYVYPLLEHHKFAPLMRKQFYEEVEKNDPEILVYTSNAGTWYADYTVQAEMFSWYKHYRDSAFRRIGLINIPYDSPTTYDWSGDTSASLVNENYIEICKRIRIKSFL